LPENFAQLKQQVIGHIRAKEADRSDDENAGIIPSTTTLTWLKLAPTFAKGARALEVVKDHPDWWMTLTWDGFSYHTIDRANEIFTECKILNIKEEGYYMLLKCVNHMTNKSPRKARVTCE